MQATVRLCLMLWEPRPDRGTRWSRGYRVSSACVCFELILLLCWIGCGGHGKGQAVATHSVIRFL